MDATETAHHDIFGTALLWVFQADVISTSQKRVIAARLRAARPAAGCDAARCRVCGRRAGCEENAFAILASH